jgi:hypothetical protein
MKATLDIPDDLYRRVKARSALEGRPLRSVAVELLQSWLDDPASVPVPAEPVASEDNAPWLAITRRALRPGQSHDLESIRGSVAAAWAAEAAEKAPANLPGKRP